MISNEVINICRNKDLKKKLKTEKIKKKRNVMHISCLIEVYKNYRQITT